MALQEHTRRAPVRLSAALLLFSLVGCQTAPPAPDRGTVGKHLAQRFGHSLPTSTAPGQFVLPPGVSLESLTEDAAVAVALWNNAAFQELLTDLGLARGDLIQAGLLPNPEFLYFFGVSQKPFKYAFEFPIEALWLRPIRVATAAREADRAAARLTQAGLDLMRDVRLAYADVLLAKERMRVAEEGVRLRGRVADLAEKRLDAGDISPQEGATARIDALQAQQDAVRAAFDIPVAEERLRNLMGMGTLRDPINLDAPLPACQVFDVDALIDTALRSRPDMLAAGEGVAAAQARLKFARIGWVRLLGIGDASSGRATGHQFGPALRFTVPIFNWNQGGIVRAEADLERAHRLRQTVANLIVLDVRRAYLQYQQACAELGVLRAKVRPEVEAAIRRAQKAYEEGNVTYLIVLETTRQLLDSYLREAMLNGDLRRAGAELERSAGRRLEAVAPASPPPLPAGKGQEPPKVMEPPSKLGIDEPPARIPALPPIPIPAPPPAPPVSLPRLPEPEPQWTRAKGTP